MVKGEHLVVGLASSGEAVKRECLRPVSAEVGLEEGTTTMLSITDSASRKEEGIL